MGQHISFHTSFRNRTFSLLGDSCEAFIKTDDGAEFKVCSQLLSRQSQFFNALFSIEEEMGKSTVIHGIETGILETVLVYLHKRSLSLSTKNMMHLLVAADFLMIDSLMQVCREYVLKNKTAEHGVRLFITGLRIKRLDMEAQGRRFLLLCFEKAVEHAGREALDLPLKVLEYFLSSKSLNVSGERAVWSFIEAWVLKNRRIRMPMVPRLLRCLSLGEIDDDLASEIISSPVIRKNKLYARLQDPRKTLDYLDDKCKAQTIVIYRNDVPFITRHRQPPRVYFVTKKTSRDNLEMFLSYDDSLDVWRKLGETSCNAREILYVDRRVYVFEEDRDGEGCIKRAHAYDVLEHKIERTISIPFRGHASCLVAEAAGRIHVLGFSTRTCRRYVEESREWVDAAPMPIDAFVNNLVAVSHNGRLYVVSSILDAMTLHVYHASEDRWERGSPPNVRRWCMASGVYQGRIIVLGGWYLDEAGFCREVEAYDPERDEWTFCAELPVRRDSLLGVVVVRERMFVYHKTAPASLMWWDGVGRWRVVRFPDFELSPFHFCPIEDEGFVRDVMRRNKAVDASVWVESGLEMEMQ